MSGAEHKTLWERGLPAKAVCHSKEMLTDPTHSRASSLPQGIQCVMNAAVIGGRQPESNLPGNGCRPQPGLKPGRATGRDCLP